MKILIIFDLTAHFFESNTIEYDNIELFDIQIETEKSIDGLRTFNAHQKEYFAELRTIRKDSAFELLCSVRTSFIWLSHRRTYICCAFSRGAKVPAETFGMKAIDEINISIRHTQVSRAQFQHRSYSYLCI